MAHHSATYLIPNLARHPVPPVPQHPVPSAPLFRSFASALLALACAGTAQAQMASPDPQTLKLSVSVGAVRGTQSLFKGVLLQSRTDPLIGVDAAMGRWFASVLNGVGYLLADSPELSVGLSANYMLGRKAANDARYRPAGALGSVGDVDGSLAAYGFFEWRPVKDAVTVYGNIARATRAQNGAQASLGATLGVPVAGKLSAFADVYVTWADARYTQAYYGVNAAQSAAAAYAVFTPKAGLLSSTPSLGLDYAVDAHWHVIGYVGRTRLAGAVANSPLVANRSQPVAALFVKYDF